MSTKVTQLILPFSTLSENRKEPFTKEMERATLFCLEELERNKGGGLILKQPPEKTVFLAQAGYPLWLMPWDEQNLIFDGLAITSHRLTHAGIPDVKGFTENLERSVKAQETYMDFLSDNMNYFEQRDNQNETLFNGLITDPELLNDLSVYLSEATQTEALSSGMAILAPTLDESAISSAIQELDGLKSTFQEDLDTLYANIKSINKFTSNWIKIIRSKIKTIQAEFREQIKKQEDIVKPKVKHIQEEYDEQITQLTRNFEKRFLPMRKEKVRLEKIQDQTLTKIERCTIEVKTAKANKNTVGEKNWKEKLEENKKNLSDTKKRIKEAEAKLKETEDQKSVEVFRLRSESETKIKEARKDIVELEATRDAKVQVHEQEIKKLNELTSTLIGQIDKTAKLREANLATIEKFGIKQKLKTNALFFVPFYLTYYQSEPKRRYTLFPPSFVNSVGFLVKLRGALGGAKIKHLLVPRFKTLSSFLNQFPALIEKNAAIEREVHETLAKTDLLKSKSTLESTRKGLEQLNAEGWFSEKEYETFKQMLT